MVTTMAMKHQARTSIASFVSVTHHLNKHAATRNPKVPCHKKQGEKTPTRRRKEEIIQRTSKLKQNESLKRETSTKGRYEQNI